MIEEVVVIGNAWGKPAGTEGPEHYWRPGEDADREKWFSICGMEILEKMDFFGGVPILHLTTERNPIQQSRCDLCMAAHPINDIRAEK